MVQADYRGARGSHAGDDFHELWALRQALTLLDEDTRLTAVAVEGLKARGRKWHASGYVGRRGLHLILRGRSSWFS